MKNKYENAEIVKDIISNIYEKHGDLKTSILIRFLDFKKKDDRTYLSIQIKDVINIFKDALKELENKKEVEKEC